ncbi:hypothetical protein ACIRVK_08655 [Streptomyces sp. NPDC101152]|uniref:hypothetical protein n=1 Tax=Streptomyces sp. NPDC101152 TaxID=3366116 RepID=UPI0037F6F8C9
MIVTGVLDPQRNVFPFGFGDRSGKTLDQEVRVLVEVDSFAVEELSQPWLGFQCRLGSRGLFQPVLEAFGRLTCLSLVLLRLVQEPLDLDVFLGERFRLLCQRVDPLRAASYVR